MPDWKQADPAWIKRALQRALARPSGGWHVLGDARAFTASPRPITVAGKALVAWRAGQELRVAPEACPHMGASLAGARVRDGNLVCPWHGLSLGDRPHGGWSPLPAFDDGVLAWVRLADPAPTDAPILAARPERFLGAVICKEARCEPEDVLANRLDPWHGVHYHPHSFGRLRVIDASDDSITVRVVYRLLGKLGVEVDARFSCPGPRSIVMTIVDGEGEGSVVETHARSIRPGETAIVEATLATSERAGFGVARAAAPLWRPLMRRAAERLWVEDAAYAERRYALRQSGAGAISPASSSSRTP